MVQHRLGRGVDFPDQSRERGAVPRLDIELQVFRIGEEIGVLHGRREGILKHLRPLCGHARRRDQRPPLPA